VGVAIKMSFLNSQWEKFQCYQLWKPPESSKIGILPWNVFHSIIFMLITRAQNFKAKTFTKKKIFKIYQHVYPWEKFLYCQLWKSSKDWNFFLTWNFFHEIIFMLITCVPNFKAKRFVQKKIFEIYQHVLLGERFFQPLGTRRNPHFLWQGCNVLSTFFWMLSTSTWMSIKRHLDWQG